MIVNMIFLACPKCGSDNISFLSNLEESDDMFKCNNTNCKEVFHLEYALIKKNQIGGQIMNSIESKEAKVCKIINGLFQYTLEVDSEKIPFYSSVAAEYFEKHYSELGYYIKKIDMNEVFHNYNSAELQQAIDNTKLCEITKDGDNWIVEVDGQTLATENGEYFDKHYTELGYAIKKIGW